jgi:hypothetical protein
VDGELWERLDGESSRAYAAFRVFRDGGPLRRVLDVAGVVGAAPATVWRWSARWDWIGRAAAWDDECRRLEDQRRLEAIRAMHDTHQRAGRVAMSKALEALDALSPGDIPAYAAARLLDLGARLERETLTVSVEELQGVVPAVDDPWEAIARELSG